MIGRLTGILVEKQAPHLLIDVNGVGYEVSAPMTTIYHLPEVGEQVMLHTHLVVREDAQLLYGFHSVADRRLFRDFLKVNGIGAKSALAILSGMETDSFVHCILHDDVAMLSRIPGIGKKTAERLIVEMRDRLSDWQAQELPQAVAADVIQISEQKTTAQQAEQDAIDVLVALGYRPAEANKAVTKIVKDTPDLPSDQIIRQALQKIMS